MRLMWSVANGAPQHVGNKNGKRGAREAAAHTRSISMNSTRAEAWQLHKAVNTAKDNLCRHRDRNPTGGA